MTKTKQPTREELFVQHVSKSKHLTNKSSDKASRTIGVETYAQEIADDLPALMCEYPVGIYLTNLQEYYGESSIRTAKACQILERRGVIRIFQAASKAYYILPAHVDPSTILAELTPQQRKVAQFMQQTARITENNRLRTDYTQLARILDCSYGGLQATIQKLVALGYLSIETPPKRGFIAAMVIIVEPKLLGDPKKPEK